jgi:hypothetical protein
MAHKYQVVELRKTEAELEKLTKDLETFKDLCNVDDLGYWKLYENYFIDLAPSKMV